MSKENHLPEESKKASSYKHIVRIANIDIPGEKKLGVALTKIKGIGMNLAHAICIVAKVDKRIKSGDLSDEQIKRLNEVTTNFSNIPTWMYNRKKDFDTGENKHLLTGTLTFTHDNDIKKLNRIKSRRGLRLQKGLTVRGQRTRSNFRRQKGKVVGVKKKAIAPKAAAKKENK